MVFTRSQVSTRRSLGSDDAVAARTPAARRKSTGRRSKSIKKAEASSSHGSRNREGGRAEAATAADLSVHDKSGEGSRQSNQSPAKSTTKRKRATPATTRKRPARQASPTVSGALSSSGTGTGTGTGTVRKSKPAQRSPTKIAASALVNSSSDSHAPLHVSPTSARAGKAVATRGSGSAKKPAQGPRAAVTATPRTRRRRMASRANPYATTSFPYVSTQHARRKSDAVAVASPEGPSGNGSDAEEELLMLDDHGRPIHLKADASGVWPEEDEDEESDARSGKNASDGGDEDGGESEAGGSEGGDRDARDDIKEGSEGDTAGEIGDEVEAGEESDDEGGDDDDEEDEEEEGGDEEEENEEEEEREEEVESLDSNEDDEEAVAVVASDGETSDTESESLRPAGDELLDETHPGSGGGEGRETEAGGDLEQGVEALEASGSDEDEDEEGDEAELEAAIGSDEADNGGSEDDEGTAVAADVRSAKPAASQSPPSNASPSADAMSSPITRPRARPAPGLTRASLQAASDAQSQKTDQAGTPSPQSPSPDRISTPPRAARASPNSSPSTKAGVRSPVGLGSPMSQLPAYLQGSGQSSSPAASRQKDQMHDAIAAADTTMVTALCQDCPWVLNELVSASAFPRNNTPLAHAICCLTDALLTNELHQADAYMKIVTALVDAGASHSPALRVPHHHYVQRIKDAAITASQPLTSLADGCSIPALVQAASSSKPDRIVYFTTTAIHIVRRLPGLKAMATCKDARLQAQARHIRNCMLKALRYILSIGISGAVPDTMGVTAYMVAAARGDYEALALLLSLDPRPEESLNRYAPRMQRLDGVWGNALEAGVIGGSALVVSMLLKSGARLVPPRGAFFDEPNPGAQLRRARAGLPAHALAFAITQRATTEIVDMLQQVSTPRLVHAVCGITPEDVGATKHTPRLTGTHRVPLAEVEDDMLASAGRSSVASRVASLNGVDDEEDEEGVGGDDVAATVRTLRFDADTAYDTRNDQVSSMLAQVNTSIASTGSDRGQAMLEDEEDGLPMALHKYFDDDEDRENTPEAQVMSPRRDSVGSIGGGSEGGDEDMLDTSSMDEEEQAAYEATLEREGEVPVDDEEDEEDDENMLKQWFGEEEEGEEGDGWGRAGLTAQQRVALAHQRVNHTDKSGGERGRPITESCCIQ